jgi:hypothetical protein
MYSFHQDPHGFHTLYYIPWIPKDILDATMSEESRELLRSALNDSAEMKEQGNKFFLDKNWTSAITAYNQALACLPKPKPPAVSHAQSGEKEQEPVDAATDMQYPDRHHREENEQEDTLIASKPDLQLTPIEQECSNTRVVLYANIAACELKLVSSIAILMAWPGLYCM